MSSINIKKFEGLKLTRKKIKQIERILSKQNNLNVTYGEQLEQLTERWSKSCNQWLSNKEAYYFCPLGM